MEIQKIKIKNDYKLPDIIHDIEKGILRIPQFQREFVWEKSKVVKLVDSIYKEFPIGSFFFWTAPKKYYFFYRDIAELNLPKPDRYEKMSLIIDGQQRLTSLYVTIKGLTLYGRDYSKICFDLDKQEFIDRTPDSQRFISVSNLFSDDYLDIYNDLTPERKKSFHQCRQKFENYPFSAVDVRDKELDEVCDIFERINQGGRRLNLFDLIVAGTWSVDFDLRESVDEENKNFEKKGFGKIDNEIFTQTLALVAKNSCTRSSQLQLRKEDIDEHWKNTIEAIRQAIDYLRNNLGVVRYLFIPYRGMISLTAYLFFKNKARSLDNKQSELLEFWFWQAAFAERYSASTLTLMTEDRKLFDKVVEKKDVKIHFPFSLEIDSLMRIRMYRKSAIKNGVLCLLATKHPRHLKNNSLLSLGDDYYSDFNSFEKHHIFPRSIIQKKFPLVMIHSLPNFCFLPAELNKEISNKNPSKYFKKLDKENSDFKDTLETHLIKYGNSVRRDNYISFLGSRATAILEEIYRLTGSKISRVIGENVNKAIDKTEELIRDLIDKKLELNNLQDWQEKVPSDVFGETKRRVQEYIKKNPSKKLSDFSSRDLLNFCDLMDYPKIILKKWDIFYSNFRSKSELEKRFISLKEYRNAIKHNREMASFIKKEGEAALEWLSMILETALSQGKQINTISEHLIGINSATKKLFQDMVKQIKTLGKVREEPRKYFVGYWNGKIKFLNITFSQDRLTLRIRIQGYKLHDPKHLAQELNTQDDYWKKLYKDIILTSSDQISDVMPLIKQAYKKSK